MFIQTPRPLNSTVGTEGEFFCRADAITVFWAVNGISVNQLDDPKITEREGELIDGIRTQILRITADTEHNNSVIQCRLFKRDEGEMWSDSVLFKVQGEPFTSFISSYM